LPDLVGRQRDTLGVNWTKVAMTPDWASANSARYAAIAARTCN